MQPRPISGGKFSPQPPVRLQPPGGIRRGRPILGYMKKGGKIKKTGAYILHKGETVRARVKKSMGKC